MQSFELIVVLEKFTYKKSLTKKLQESAGNSSNLVVVCMEDLFLRILEMTLLAIQIIRDTLGGGREGTV